jgi:hypothetical protein
MEKNRNPEAEASGVSLPGVEEATPTAFHSQGDSMDEELVRKRKDSDGVGSAEG